MTNSQPSLGPPPGIDAEHFSADFQKQANERAKKRDRLWMRVLHKAFNMPEEEDVPNVDASRHGLGWPELAIVAAMVAAAATGAWWLAQSQQPPPQPPAAAASPADKEYEVRHYDAQGNLIEVPRLPATATQR